MPLMRLRKAAETLLYLSVVAHASHCLILLYECLLHADLILKRGQFFSCEICQNDTSVQLSGARRSAFVLHG